MSDLPLFTRAVSAAKSLHSEEIRAAALALAADGPDEEKALFLSALSRKGETPAEIAAFASAFRALALDPGLSAWAPRAVDIVGTGGDHAGGYNISTLATLVVACAGVPVIKHGNRGITSRCGSADLFTALGFDIEAAPERLPAAMALLQYVFLFAPAWHPAFRRIGPVRKALAARGERTVFNILGPLLNPAGPANLLLGAASTGLVETLSEAMDILEVGAGLAVHGIIDANRGIDELTTATTNRVRGAGRLRGLAATWTPEAFGLRRAAFSEISGGGVAENLALAEALVSGGGPAGLADTVAFNAATALWIAGARPQGPDTIAEARELLQGGAVRKKIADTRDFFAQAARTS